MHPVLKEGTARGILKQAGVTEEEFFAEYCADHRLAALISSGHEQLM
jgi:hypothetical protein